ncbi:membrane protein insertase YidC [Clostridium beijerinckii]|uniref:Membrane protein insertase MisCA n=1 Tax=Clostridium beijerinckii TaxID=1520 RepID=A0A1S8RZH2_CLOBE|nr:membrane protein insertase YidC [Clostridium beijerinckii]NMF06917.1 membrane protein insertase YidC [Clostridium beijerinckii]NRY60963.1 YidC/Oxa1 family membrane protein insertase [Clostridium beijerinckii]OOM58597.1 membrane protein insertase MisCA precursor [Clostridium beijerinckii]
MFQAIVNFMKGIFDSLHDFIVSMGISDVGLSYVLAIFIFTLIIRILILPFNVKAAKSSQGMQKIQPEVKKLQAKYKDDPQKLNTETMRLYKENNVSVAGGCLPSLLPLPILMALYWVFMGIQGIEGASFLWIHDLFAPDKYYILPVLAALSTYIPSYLMSKSTPSQPGGMNMGSMNLVMAGMMGVMSLNFKSILVLYWIIGNLIQTIQTYFLNYRPAMREMDDKTQKDAVAESDKFVMAVEEPKNSASKKRKKK